MRRLLTTGALLLSAVVVTAFAMPRFMVRATQPSDQRVLALKRRQSNAIDLATTLRTVDFSQAGGSMLATSR